ncbi:alpha/beta fold hydrolase [Methylophilus sp. TWE2]|uniref:alpha/beta fold hydrolase n=1 Tax=Methylophilus sp. TWE2 TaxID=1662285 RepID=UPI0009E37E6B|nr:alpha/beta hydrolase [Methylophilus sp. TWE2]
MKKILLMIGVVFSLFLTGCSTISHGEYTQNWTQSAPELLTLEGGVTVRYMRTGNGPPLVLLHTIRTQLDYFEKLVPLLSSQYEVIVLDLPGHGQSSIDDIAYTEEFFRRTTKEFITRLDLKEVTLAGESIGGVLALTVSTELPDRVTRVFSLNPYDYGEQFGGGIRRSKNGWMVGLFNIFGSYTLEPRFVTAAVMHGGFYDVQKLPEDLLTEFSNTGKREGYRGAEYTVFRHWKTWIAARQLYPRVSAPVTLIYGSDDWSNPSERIRNQKEIAHANLITIEKSGHFTALESPEKVAEIILGK